MVPYAAGCCLCLCWLGNGGWWIGAAAQQLQPGYGGEPAQHIVRELFSYADSCNFRYGMGVWYCAAIYACEMV
jgi:hypothetical protein